MSSNKKRSADAIAAAEAKLAAAQAAQTEAEAKVAAAQAAQSEALTELAIAQTKILRLSSDMDIVAEDHTAPGVES
jgi:chromosome segregation ATPase